MNAEQLKQYEELAAGALLLGRDRHASAIMAPIAEVERLQRELQQAQAQLAGGKPEPTAEENGAAEFRVKRIGELYTQFGNNRDTWPQWAQDVFARLSGAQNEYEAKYC